MTHEQKPELAELSDADLDTTAGGAIDALLVINRLSSGTSHTKGEVPVEDIHLNYEPIKSQ